MPFGAEVYLGSAANIPASEEAQRPAAPTATTFQQALKLGWSRVCAAANAACTNVAVSRRLLFSSLLASQRQQQRSSAC